MLLANASQIRQTDQVMIAEHDFPGLLLMETAGRKCAEYIFRQEGTQPLYRILCGPGNNGGDGFVIARYLHLAACKVEIILSSDPDRFQGDAAIQYAALKGADIPVLRWPLSEADTEKGLSPNENQPIVLIDALLGTGVSDELRGHVAEMVVSYGDIAAKVYAIDMPSGLDANDGQVHSVPIPAETTLTFQLPKLCHLVHPAASYCGEIVVIDIGVWPEVLSGLGIRRKLLTGGLVRQQYRQRPVDGHKGSFGHAVLIGGSRAYAGAIALSGLAALNSGAGLSSVLTVEPARMSVLQGQPEVMTQAIANGDVLDGSSAALALEYIKDKTAVGIGPGLGSDENTAVFLRRLLEKTNQPVVLDADALNLIADDPTLWELVPKGSVITPHPGEMARLCGTKAVIAQRLSFAENLAAEKCVIVVLKGAGTIIACPEGHSYVNFSGNPGMGTAGAGDVLTGTIVGWMAQGQTPEVAALMGVYLHGLSADLLLQDYAPEGITASMIRQGLGTALKTTLHNQEPKLKYICDWNSD